MRVFYDNVVFLYWDVYNIVYLSSIKDKNSMSNNYEKASFKKLLEKLQEDSWQLELLISGFAIFGLFYALEPVGNANMEAIKNGESIFVLLLQLLLTFLFILIFNLMLHIILRGLWIGALGLRYVSGDIDFDELNYSNKFTKYLKREKAMI